MLKPYKPYIAKTLGELSDILGSMMLYAPTFKDNGHHFPDRNIDTTFEGLIASLDNLRSRLGDERYAKMRAMSDEMRALFEADPESRTGGSRAGRVILHEMERMLRRQPPAPGETAIS